MRDSNQPLYIRRRVWFPDKLLVYHGKVGKTVFIGVLKMGTMFFFIGTCVVIAPALSKDPDMPWWATPLAVLLGTVPMLAVGYATAPFVTFAHLHLPPHVRRSWERIVIYSKRLPPDAKLTISTMRFSTFSRTTQINVSDLRPMKAWYTAANICNPRTSFGLQSKAPWLLGGPVHQFYIGPQEKKVLRDEIWRNIMKKIQH
ncbi:MAG: hypothetical protein M1834_006763 [Cirrosporium novae-zelandiae]|nr:MAG: hypothetical protein M1834_006763 [Cirrosporium novae-zelandiae]